MSHPDTSLAARARAQTGVSAAGSRPPSPGSASPGLTMDRSWPVATAADPIDV